MNEHEEQPLAESPTLPDVVRYVVTDFVVFGRQHLTRPRPPQMLIVLWLLGMEAIAGALEVEFLQTGRYLTENWFHTWLRILFGGIPAAALRYWIVGTMFHLAVIAAGGTGTARTSRHLFLYAAIPVAIVNILIKVFQMIAYGDNYFSGQASDASGAATSFIMAVAYVYTLRLCYVGMIHVQNASPRRSALLLAAAVFAMMLVVLVFMS